MTTSAWIADGTCPREAYTTLLDRWRSERTAARSTLLVALADRRRATLLLQSRPEVEAVLAADDPRDTGALAHALFGLSLAEAVDLLPHLDDRLPDPSAAHGFIAGLAAWPASFTGSAALGFWSDVFERVAASGDASCLGALDRAIAPWRGTFEQTSTGSLRRRWVLFNRTVPDLQTLLARRHPRREEPDPSLAADAREVVARATAHADRVGRCIAVREDPDALAVAADDLVQHGDPLGTFVTLALQQERTPAQDALAERLLHVHGAQWTAPLTPVLRDVRFEHGFPSSATVLPVPAVRRLLDHPGWTSFHTLAFEPEGDGRAPSIGLPRLRRLTGVDADILERDDLPALRHLGIRDTDGAMLLRSRLAATALQLQTLSIDGLVLPSAWPGGAETMAGLELLELRTTSRAPWVPMVPDLPCELILRSDGWIPWRLHYRDHGRALHVTLQWTRQEDWSLTLRGLPELLGRARHVHLGAAPDVDAAHLPAIRDALLAQDPGLQVAIG
jgi:hypothetical protein